MSAAQIKVQFCPDEPIYYDKIITLEDIERDLSCKSGIFKGKWRLLAEDMVPRRW